MPKPTLSWSLFCFSITELIGIFLTNQHMLSSTVLRCCLLKGQMVSLLHCHHQLHCHKTGYSLSTLTMPTEGRIVKAMVFPVVMYGCENWNIKEAEHLRIDDFKLWWWRKLLRVPWTAMRSNQSILKEINPEYSLEGLLLKLQYFGHLMQRANSLEKTLMLGKIEGEAGSRGWDALPTQWTWIWGNSRR